MLLTRVEEGRVAGYKRWRRVACHTRLAHFPKVTVAPCRSHGQEWVRHSLLIPLEAKPIITDEHPESAHTISSVGTQLQLQSIKLTRVIKRPIIIRSEVIHRPLRVPDPSRVNCQHRATPTGDFIVRPNLPDLIRCAAGHLVVDGWGVGKHALKHDHAARVAVQVWILPPGDVQPLIVGVETAHLWRGSHVLGDSRPLLRDGLVEALFPLAGDVEAVAPVGDLGLGGKLGCSWYYCAYGDCLPRKLG
jgi:hypothetical protein